MHIKVEMYQDLNMLKLFIPLFSSSLLPTNCYICTVYKTLALVNWTSVLFMHQSLNHSYYIGHRSMKVTDNHPSFNQEIY